MKLSKTIKHIYRKFYLARYRILCAFFLMCILLALIGKATADTAPKGVNYSVFDILAHISGRSGVTGILSLVFPVVPTFCFILMSLIEIDNQIFQVIRSKSRAEIWNNQTAYVFIIALIYSVSIIFGGYIFSGVFVGSFTNNWRMNDSFIHSMIGKNPEWIQISNNFFTYKILTIIFISNFLGLCTLGIMICTLKIFFKNIYVFIALTVILVSDGILDKFSLVLKQMTINLKNWITPSTIIINDIYLLLVVVILYIVGKEFYYKKDFVNKF